MLAYPDISPIAFEVFGLPIRWYAISYLMGFILGWFYVRYLHRSYHQQSYPSAYIDDFLTWTMLGVIAGGRLGYILFYNLDVYLENPLHIFFVWQGGMSFHGGAAGVIIALFLFARAKQIKLFELSDMVCAAVPIGLLFGRMANFINGELYGRVTSYPFGMVFPDTDGLPRHPSQLYEAASEGLFLFILLFILMRFKAVRDRPGIVSAVFLMGYGVCRFMIEYVREPDAQLGILNMGLTMGQILCLPMILGGAAVLLVARGTWPGRNGKIHDQIA